MAAACHLLMVLTSPEKGSGLFAGSGWGGPGRAGAAVQSCNYCGISVQEHKCGVTLYVYSPPKNGCTFDKFNICVRTCVRAHNAHVRARVMNSSGISGPGGRCRLHEFVTCDACVCACKKVGRPSVCLSLLLRPPPVCFLGCLGRCCTAVMRHRWDSEL